MIDFKAKLLRGRKAGKKYTGRHDIDERKERNESSSGGKLFWKEAARRWSGPNAKNNKIDNVVTQYVVLFPLQFYQKDCGAFRELLLLKMGYSDSKNPRFEEMQERAAVIPLYNGNAK